MHSPVFSNAYLEIFHKQKYLHSLLSASITLISTMHFSYIYIIVVLNYICTCLENKLPDILILSGTILSNLLRNQLSQTLLIRSECWHFEHFSLWRMRSWCCFLSVQRSHLSLHGLRNRKKRCIYCTPPISFQYEPSHQPHSFCLNE